MDTKEGVNLKRTSQYVSNISQVSGRSAVIIPAKNCKELVCNACAGRQRGEERRVWGTYTKTFMPYMEAYFRRRRSTVYQSERSDPS
jgi:hypothetical protein